MSIKPMIAKVTPQHYAPQQHILPRAGKVSFIITSVITLKYCILGVSFWI